MTVTPCCPRCGSDLDSPRCPDCGWTSGASRRVLVLAMIPVALSVALAVGIGWVLASGGRNGSLAKDAPRSPIPSFPGKPVTVADEIVEARALFLDGGANMAALVERFHGRTATLGGTVALVQPRAASLSGGGVEVTVILDGVSCHFSRQSADAAKRLQTGQRVNVRGTVRVSGSSPEEVRRRALFSALPAIIDVDGCELVP